MEQRISAKPSRGRGTLPQREGAAQEFDDVLAGQHVAALQGVRPLGLRVRGPVLTHPLLQAFFGGPDYGDQGVGAEPLHLEQGVGDTVDGKVMGESVDQDTLHGVFGYRTLERQLS